MPGDEVAMSEAKDKQKQKQHGQKGQHDKQIADPHKQEKRCLLYTSRCV